MKYTEKEIKCWDSGWDLGIKSLLDDETFLDIPRWAFYLSSLAPISNAIYFLYKGFKERKEIEL